MKLKQVADDDPSAEYVLVDGCIGCGSKCQLDRIKPKEKSNAEIITSAFGFVAASSHDYTILLNIVDAKIKKAMEGE